MFCDSHTHLSEFSESEVTEVLNRATEAGVYLIVAAGTTLESSRKSVSLAQEHASVRAGVGLHPMNIQGPVSEETWEELYALAGDRAAVVCVSETGLDFMSGAPPRELQEQVFRRHIHMALDLDLPLVVHSREAHADVLRMLKDEGASRVGGIMHYFQADLETARQAIDSGLLISLAKPLLRLPELQSVAAQLPLEHIVLETDAAPQPWKRHRKNWTEPWQVKLVAEKLAELKNVPIERVAEATSANLRRLLKLN